MAEIVVKLTNGALAGKTAQDIAKEVNGAALAMKKAEIGTADWVKASEKLDKAKGMQVDLKKQIEGTAKASDTLKAAWNKLPGAQYFNQISASFSSAKNGVGGLVSQFGVLKTAIASTGIGLLVLALSSLISYFTSTQEGMDKITAVTRPLKAIFEALVGVLQNLGGKIFKQLSEAIQNPTQALKDLGQIIVDNVINRFKALALFGPAFKKIMDGEFSEGFKALGNAVLQATTGIEDVVGKVSSLGSDLVKVVDEAYEKGKKLDALQKDIERSEINQIVRSKQIELAIKQQKDAVEDGTKSWVERKDAAKKALDLQQTALKDELTLLDKRITKIKIEQSLNDTSREQEKELAELVAKKLEVEARFTEQSIEFKKKLQEFSRAEQQEEEKKVALQEANRQKEIESEKAHRVKLFEDKMKAHELDLATDQNIINEQYLNKDISEQEFLDRSATRLIDYHQKRLETLATQFGVESTEYQNEYAKLLELQIASATASVEVTKWLATDGGQALLGSLSTFGNAFSQIASMHEQGTASWKTFAIAAATISAIQGSINAYASTSAIPVVGPILAPIAAGVALAAGMFNVKKIKSIKQPAPTKKMATGGLLTGPSHAGGGIPIEAEGGEFVFSRRATSLIGANALASLNNRYTFANGGSVPMPSSPYSSPTFSKTNEKSGGILHSNLYPRVDKLEEFAYDISDWAKNLKVTNNLQDTNKGLNVLNKLKEEADV